MPLVPLRSAIDGWLPGRRPATDALSTIAAAWPAIVGPAVAAHSAPIALNGKSLIVATRSSAWSQQLQFLSVTILRGLAAIALDEPVERLAFRSGSLRVARTGGVPLGAALPFPKRVADPEPELEPAADAGEALARLRRRVTSARRRAPSSCVACGAPVEASVARTCAPCEGGAARERTLQLERIVYLAPWLGVEELRRQLPELSAAEFEGARRALLQRWWLVLERCRRSGKVSGTRLERQVASSYVLLQSRLSPDRITPAIVRNLLGDELDAMLWPGSGDKANPGDSSKTTRQ